MCGNSSPQIRTEEITLRNFWRKSPPVLPIRAENRCMRNCGCLFRTANHGLLKSSKGAVVRTATQETINMLQETEILRRAHSIAETCALTGIGRDAVYAAIRDGRLVARKLGRRTVITDDDLRQFLNGLPRLALDADSVEDCVA
jgi:excisionase family DNA binding protein